VATAQGNAHRIEHGETSGGGRRQPAPQDLLFSIVLLTHNRRDTVLACINRIWAKTATPVPDYELIVIDNGSDDGTSRAIQELHPRVHAEDRRYTTMHLPSHEGVCARNHGIMIARGQFILQVDDDVEVGLGWDKFLLEAFTDAKVGAAGQEGFYLNWAGLLAGPWMAPNFLDDRRPLPGDYADLVMGYCWAWRNLRGLDGWPVFQYDPRFNPHWHEETDLQLQIKTAGFRIRCGLAVVVHRSQKDWQKALANDPKIGLHHAADHERLLIEKWADKRELLALELDRRGLA
jgi:glycosyltransferase involved in cell wall biosynthesis